EPAFSERPMTDADVHVTRALLRMLLRGGALASRDVAALRGDVDAALADDPTNVLANVVFYAVNKSLPADGSAQALIAAHPQDWRAWLLYAASLPPGKQEYAVAARRVCELVAANPAINLPEGACPR